MTVYAPEARFMAKMLASSPSNEDWPTSWGLLCLLSYSILLFDETRVQVGVSVLLNKRVERLCPGTQTILSNL